MYQKVVNVAPTWAQVGAMLGSKIVLDTSKSDTEKNIQKHKQDMDALYCYFLSLHRSVRIG